jgi:phosphopantothenoylcysteine decarboxylase/phosphopantothenate--cysteine ligase
MSSFNGKCVVLGVTGGIAVYKALDVVSRLKKKGIDVRVIMTKSACEFVTPMTFEVMSGNRVISDMFSRDFTWEVEHISLAKRADVFAVVPATANFIGKVAGGIADDMLTTTVMATKAPLVIAPAMNTGMYENPVVQTNIEKLKAKGASFVEPASGHLACGDTGKGKLADPAKIEHAILAALTEKDMAGLKVLVTAGPTQEALDPVRFLSNHSTGKMGYSIAQAAADRGAQVTLISGPVHLPVPENVSCISVTSAQEMYDAVMDILPSQDLIVKAAAVGDYRPAAQSQDKIKKSDADMSIALVRNPDILQEIGRRKTGRQTVCGFSMETKDLLVNSKAKLQKKNCDMMVANNLKVAGAGFAVDTNVATFLYPDGKTEGLDLMQKDELADILLTNLLAIFKAKD